jgi:hypothetical protein
MVWSTSDPFTFCKSARTYPDVTPEITMHAPLLYPNKYPELEAELEPVCPPFKPVNKVVPWFDVFSRFTFPTPIFPPRVSVNVTVEITRLVLAQGNRLLPTGPFMVSAYTV